MGQGTWPKSKESNSMEEIAQGKKNPPFSGGDDPGQEGNQGCKKTLGVHETFQSGRPRLSP